MPMHCQRQLQKTDQAFLEILFKHLSVIATFYQHIGEAKKYFIKHQYPIQGAV